VPLNQIIGSGQIKLKATDQMPQTANGMTGEGGTPLPAALAELGRAIA